MGNIQYNRGIYFCIVLSAPESLYCIVFICQVDTRLHYHVNKEQETARYTAHLVLTFLLTMKFLI
jgi:hypothetical protein